MSANLIAKASTSISAPASRVWEALTNPELIKNTSLEHKQFLTGRKEVPWNSKVNGKEKNILTKG